MHNDPGGDDRRPGYAAGVLVLLPPSETKRAGGDGPPLRLDALSHHAELGATRATLVDELVALADDVPASRAALGVSERQDDEIERNASLLVSPTLPALDRYTGVLYDALDARSFTRATRARARSRLAVASALFGLVHADDPIPAYRLSVGVEAARPRRRRPDPADRAAGGPVLEPLLAAHRGRRAGRGPALRRVRRARHGSRTR